MRPLVFGVAAQGGVTYGIPFSDTVLARSLSAGVAEAFTVPAGARHVVLSATADFHARPDATAAIPGDVTDGTASELNPTIRNVDGVASISVISAEACIVTASFYS